MKLPIKQQPVEVDYNAMDVTELIRLKDYIAELIESRKRDNNPLVIAVFEAGTREEKVIYNWCLHNDKAPRYDLLRLSDISGQPIGAGRMTLTYINYTLKEYGYEPAV